VSGGLCILFGCNEAKGLYDDQIRFIIENRG